MTVSITSDTIIGAGQTIDQDGPGTVVRVDRAPPAAAPSVFLFGAITGSMVNGGVDDIYGVTFGNDLFEGSIFRIEASGRIAMDATGSTVSVYGIRSTAWASDIVNHGVIEITSTYDAFGVDTGSPSDFSFINTGQIRVTGGGVGSTFGVRSGSGSHTNSGLIEVHAANNLAMGIAITANAGDIDNSGTIIATDTSEANLSTGISLAPSALPGTIVHVNNSGYIRSDIAIARQNNGGSARVEVTNTGEIHGAINFVERVTNNGGIWGDVTLRFGADEYNGAGGTLVGTVHGLDGADVLIGGVGADSLDGGADNDQLQGGGGDDNLFGGAGTDQLQGGDGNDQLYQGSPFAADPDDWGADTMDGGSGFDTGLWSFANRSEAITFTLLAPGLVSTFSLGGSFGGSMTGVEVLHFDGGAGNDDITGGDLADRLVGNGGVDILRGMGGGDNLSGGAGDTLIGGADNDTYGVGDVSTVVVEAAGEGFLDTIHIHYIGASFDLDNFANIERLFYSGANAVTLTSATAGGSIIGGDGNDLLLGRANADTLDGRGGADEMRGRAGSDIYSLDSAGDIVVELEDGGDRDSAQVFFSASFTSYTLTDHVEEGTGFGGGTLNGNALNNQLVGNGGGAYVLRGFAGEDQIYGSSFNDTLDGGDDLDGLYGGDGDDILIGGNGNDGLLGAAGVDTARYDIASTGATWRRTPEGAWSVNAGALGRDTVTNVEFLDFTDRDVFLDRAYSTFSGDGTSDVFMRHSTGSLGAWFIGPFGVTGAAGLGALSAQWGLEGVGDFNGDSKDDILMWNDNGFLGMWFMNGGSISGAAGPGVIDKASWDIEAIGDLNGDGKDDILMWHDSGSLGVWFMDGGTASGAGLGNVSQATFDLEGLGDFNGDGKDDILWKDVSGNLGIWFMNGATPTGAGIGNIGTTWGIEGIGDFNGDGRDDILMRHDTGSLGVWFMNGSSASGAGLGNVSHDFAVAAVGDYNGDGKDDILWWHDNGNLGVWFMNGSAATGQGLGLVSHDWILNPS